jgi:hypothetical protein
MAWTGKLRKNKQDRTTRQNSPDNIPGQDVGACVPGQVDRLART